MQRLLAQNRNFRPTAASLRGQVPKRPLIVRAQSANHEDHHKKKKRGSWSTYGDAAASSPSDPAPPPMRPTLTILTSQLSSASSSSSSSSSSPFDLELPSETGGARSPQSAERAGSPRSPRSRAAIRAELFEVPSPRDTSINPWRPGNLFGGVATAVAASISSGSCLALPSTTASVGFAPSCALLVVLWVLLLFESLILAEVNIALNERERRIGKFKPHANSVYSISDMGRQTLGDGAGLVLGLAYVLLQFSLNVAYIEKAGHELSFLASSLPQGTGSVLFALITGALMLAGGRTTGRWNNIAILCGVPLFIALTAAGVLIDQPNLTELSSPTNSHWTAAPSAIPFLFLSLCCCDVVPVITTQLEYDRNKVRTAIGLGSVIPLAAILAWLAINDNSMIRANSFGEPLLSLAREFGHGAGMRTFALGLEAFTCLSMTCGFILTSITVADFVSYELTRARRLATIGNIVDLSPKPTTLDFESHFEGAMFGAQDPVSDIRPGLEEQLVKAREGTPLKKLINRLVAGIDDSLGWLEDLTHVSARDIQKSLVLSAVLVPPTVLALDDVDSFLPALSLAGGYFSALLFGFFPPLMAIALRDKERTKDPGPGGMAFSYEKMVPGGNGVLVVCSMAGFGISLAKLATDLSKLGLNVGSYPELNEVFGVVAASF